MFLGEILREHYINNNSYALNKIDKTININVTHEYLFLVCDMSQFGGKYDTDGYLSNVKNSNKSDIWI